MRATQFLVRTAAFAVLFGALPDHVLADGVSPAARLSAALGGDLGSGMSDAGGMGHGSVNSSVERRIGRSEAYRRRVALDTRLAAGAKDQFATTASIYGP